MADQKDPKYKGYLSNMAANQRRLYGFIYAMIPNHSVAEDIMQETTLVMWEQYDQFQEGTNFSAWGIGIARNIVLRYCRKQKRQFLIFDSQVVENLMDQSQVFESEGDQIEALRNCFKKLKAADQELLKKRYFQKLSIQAIAETVNLSTSRLYRIMAGIHNLLLKCINLQGGQ